MILFSIITIQDSEDNLYKEAAISAANDGFVFIRRVSIYRNPKIIEGLRLCKVTIIVEK